MEVIFVCRQKDFELFAASSGMRHPKLRVEERGRVVADGCLARDGQIYVWASQLATMDHYRWLFGNLVKAKKKSINPGELCVLVNKLATQTLQHVLSKMNKTLKPCLTELDEQENAPAMKESSHKKAEQFEKFIELDLEFQ